MVVAAIVMQWSAPYSLSAAVLACSVCVGGGGGCNCWVHYNGGLAFVRSFSDRISWSVVSKHSLNSPIISSRDTLEG